MIKERSTSHSQVLLLYDVACLLKRHLQVHVSYKYDTTTHNNNIEVMHVHVNVGKGKKRPADIF